MLPVITVAQIALFSCPSVLLPMHWKRLDTRGAARLSGAPPLPLEGTGALIAEETRLERQGDFRGAPLTLLA